MKVMRMMPFYPAPYTDADIASATTAVEGKTEMGCSHRLPAGPGQSDQIQRRRGLP